MRFAYADPPYFGHAGFYAEHHPEAASYDDLETHRVLIERLCGEFTDGWALSLTSQNLKDILPLCPRDCRVAAWVKPFASFKKHVNPAFAWEPVIFRGGRKQTLTDQTVRDWVAESITLRRGLTGAKPRKFCLWIIKLMHALPGDEFLDLFPGTNAFGAVWADYTRQKPPFPPLPLEASSPQLGG